MPLDKINFEYQSYYVGWWSRPDFPDEKISGTLFIENQKIWIELVFKPSNNDFPEFIERLDGTTFAINSSKKGSSANIVAEGLSFINYYHLENGLWYYKFSVSDIYIYEGTLDKDNINCICIRANILDKWAAHILEQAYKPVPYEQLPYGHQLIHYVQPIRYDLLHNNQISVYLNFVAIRHIDRINQGFKQKTFCKIAFKGNTNFQEALEVV
ncbi:MAG: hypothetical protein J1E95_10375, partial [Muribaculaceae bacterium]|nr:hypothetical protein [Muribaculaceae bacterium]